MDLMDTGDYNPVHILLGLDSLDQLMEMSDAERRTIFIEHLVADEPLELDESKTLNLGPEPEERALRLLMERAGNGERESQFAEEARLIYYQENKFVMWSTHLEIFLKGDYGDGTSSIPVRDLVRVMTIGLLCHRGDYEEKAHALQKALCFSHLNHLSIEFWGHGALNGSDLATQRMLCAVSKTMKQIIQRFDACLTVSKALVDWEEFGIGYPHEGWIQNTCDLRPYWKVPTEEVIAKVKDGVGSLEELMQVQIAVWTDPDSVAHWFNYDEVVW